MISIVVRKYNIESHIFKDQITDLVLSQDNKYLATVSVDQSIKLIDFETRVVIHHFERAHESIYE